MITVAIFAYNEEKNIEQTVKNVLAANENSCGVDLEIILVNDGSTDRTGLIADSLAEQHDEVRVVHQPKNMGIGSAITTALKEAKGEKFMVVPGDNDLDTNIIVNLLSNSSKAELVIAYFVNREIRGRGRTTLSIVYNTIYMCTFGVFLMYINGPFVADTKKLRSIEINSKRFSIVAEIVLKLLLSGCSYHEVPGNICMGKNNSTALSLKNLIEVMHMYFKLVIDILILQRDEFSTPPVRIK